MENNDVLYLKYRPKNFKELLGQKDAEAQLKEMAKREAIPHAILLTGPSGCGKTTIARILREKLKCHDNDYTEQNCASARGIDEIREIENTMRISPMIPGGTRIWTLDECHRLTPDAQSALLKILEDTPRTVYFFLATTDPQKLLATIKTRCTEIRCKVISDEDLMTLVSGVVKAEGRELSAAVLKKIVQVAGGSARKALVLLHQAIGLATEAEQLKAVQEGDVEALAIDICRALMSDKTTWKDMANLLRTTKEDPEAIRHAVLGYAKSVLLNSGSGKAYDIIACFRFPFYDSHMPGLVAACYEVMHPR